MLGEFDSLRNQVEDSFGTRNQVEDSFGTRVQSVVEGVS